MDVLVLVSNYSFCFHKIRIIISFSNQQSNQVVKFEWIIWHWFSISSIQTWAKKRLQLINHWSVKLEKRFNILRMESSRRCHPPSKTWSCSSAGGTSVWFRSRILIFFQKHRLHPTDHFRFTIIPFYFASSILNWHSILPSLWVPENILKWLIN